MRNFINHFLLFLVSAIYGATFSVAKDVMPEFLGPFGFIVLRVSTAAVLFWLVHLLFIREKVRSLKDYGSLMICGFFGMAANMLMFFKGLEITYPINASVLMLGAPVFVLVFQSFMYKTAIRAVQWSGIALAMAGALLLMAGKRFQFSSDTIWGDALVLINAIFYSFYLVYVKQLLVKYHFVTVAKWSFTFALLFVIPVGYGQVMEADFAGFPTFIWYEIIFVVVFTTFLTYFLNAFVIQRSSPALVGSYIYLQPILATLIAVWWGKDELTIEKFVFALLIFVGVYLINKRRYA